MSSRGSLMILKSDILEIASILDEDIQKALGEEKTKVDVYEEQIAKSLSHNPFQPHIMTEESPYYNPYRQMEDGTFLPHPTEHWEAQGKSVEGYLTTKVLYQQYLAPTENKFAQLRRSLEKGDLIKAGAVPLAKPAAPQGAGAGAAAGGRRVPIGTVHMFKDGNQYQKKAEGVWVPYTQGGGKPPHPEEIEQHASKIEKVKQLLNEKRKEQKTVQTATTESTRNALSHFKEILGKLYDGPIPKEISDHVDKLTARAGIPDALQQKIKKLGKGQGREVSLSSDEVSTLLQSGKFALISAGRNPAHPQDRELPEEQVKARYNELRKELVDGGYAFSRVTGHYGAVEDSYLVMVHDADKDHMLKLGKKFNQDSVIHSEGGQHEMHYTTGGNAGQHIKGEGLDKDADKAEDYYSEIKTSDGKTIKFSLNFDFSKMHDGKKTQEDKPKPLPQLAPPKIAANERTNKFAGGKYSDYLDSDMMKNTKGKDVTIMQTSLFQKMARKELPEIKKRMVDFAMALSKEGVKIEGMKVRDKDASSLLKKMNTKWADKTLDQVVDGIGARFVVENQKDADALIRRIPRLFGMQVLEHENKTNNEGYRAHHLLVRTPGGFMMEIQIKTKSQDHWSQWSHKKIYKNEELKADKAKFNEANKYANAVSERLDKQDRGQDPGPKPEAPQFMKDAGHEYDWSGKKIFNEDFDDVFDVDKDKANLVPVDKLVSRDSPKDAIDRSEQKLKDTIDGKHDKREPLTVWKVNKPDGSHYFSVRDGNTTLQMLRDRHDWKKFPVSVEKEVSEAELTPVPEHKRKGDKA